jgi:hypothetical protein
MRVLDEAANRVVCAAEVAFRLELQLGHHASLWTTYVGLVAQLVLHGAEEDAACVHVWLGDEASSW